MPSQCIQQIDWDVVARSLHLCVVAFQQTFLGRYQRLPNTQCDAKCEWQM